MMAALLLKDREEEDEMPTGVACAWAFLGFSAGTILGSKYEATAVEPCVP